MKVLRKHILLFILIISICFRIVLAHYQIQANDNHAEYVSKIIELKKQPSIYDCFECFQPPLYYHFIAKLSIIIGKTSYYDICRLLQEFTLISGFILCLLIYLIINKSNLHPKWKIIMLLFWLFNPMLITINIMPSNDSLVITCISLSIYYLLRYINTNTLKYFLLTIIFFLLAPIIKGSGLILIPILLVLSLRNFIFKQYIKLTAFVLIIYLPLILFLGGYIDHKIKYGQFFKINDSKPISAPFIDQQSYKVVKKRLGIKSVVSGYLSFPFLSLLKTPYINLKAELENRPRSNYFIMMYAQFYTSHFLNHPMAWVNNSTRVQNLSRTVFILGLPIFILFILSIFYGISIININKNMLNQSIFWYLLSFATCFMFSIVYSYMYRDFSFIKIIFIYPVILSMIEIFNQIVVKCFHLKYINRGFMILMLSIILLFIIDISILLIDFS